MNRILGNWYEASVAGVEDFARANGFKQVFIHGIGVRANLSGHNTDRDPTLWMKQMYFDKPPTLGYEEGRYSEYPSADAETQNKVLKNFEKDDENLKPFWKDLRDQGKELLVWKKKL